MSLSSIKNLMASLSIGLIGLALWTSPSLSTQKHRPTLGELAKLRGIDVGTFYFQDEYAQTQEFINARQEFNMVTLPVFFRQIQPSRDQFDFTIPAAVADQLPDDTVFQIPGFVWCGHLPEWLMDQNLDADQLENIMLTFVRSVFTYFNSRYPDRIVAWQIINEDMSPDHPQGPVCPWRRIGLERGAGAQEYVRIALREARRLDPSAKLYINEFGVESPVGFPNADRTNRFFSLVSDLKSEGLIDGVGFQSHFTVEEHSGDYFPPPSIQEIAGNFRKFEALGLEIRMTEVDLGIEDGRVSRSVLKKQARYYRQLLRVCLELTSCKSFTIWGVGSRDSWFNDLNNGFGEALLFDWNYRPKPAYRAIRRELKRSR